jgi:uncharacterized protein (DUF2249 family)
LLSPEVAVPTLDLRTLAPPVRHGLVYQALDALAPGEVLELVNDHKPSPLRYELEAIRPGQYAWEDADAGPEVFSARITARVRTVDARPILARGEEPFGTIMAAVDALEAGEDLVVLTPFEPVPLEGVLGGQGFTFEAVTLESGDWRVTFRRPG